MINILSLQSIIDSGKSESVTILILLLSSLCIRFILELFGQRWIKTTSHTATLAILPVITYVITTVISGNIALSLGMVGALSIVRFRNPVRSPLELCVYFAAITMGITAAVSLSRLIFFIFSIFLIAFILFLISYLFKKISKKTYFTTSFSEGNTLSSLELSCICQLPLLENSKYLKSKSLQNKKINYLLVSENFQILKDILMQVENDKNIIEYQLNDE
tara:strand:- start:1786 stop:2442 length:657 start_codon:yes stop_codon:yes gene_type:complete